MKSVNIEGLYVVTDPALSGSVLSDAVEHAIAGGASMVQYRQKDRRLPAYRDDAVELRKISRRHQTVLIINDNPLLAAEINADGVHIGRSDVTVAQARAVVGNDKIIGVSCYNDIELALRAEREGADYVAFGSFFSSSIKPDAVYAPIDLITRAKREMLLPVVAIGGIDQFNGSALIEAGADALAVISAVFAQSDIQKAAQALSDLFDKRSEPRKSQ